MYASTKQLPIARMAAYDRRVWNDALQATVLALPAMILTRCVPTHRSMAIPALSADTKLRSDADHQAHIGT